MKQNIIPFKSSNEFFFKEQKGFKRNTCRKVELTDRRFEDLHRIMTHGASPNDYIEISFVSNLKVNFKRKIKDVSYWEGIFIISW